MAKNKNIKRQDYGLFRVATAIPTVKVADVEYNLKQHIQLLKEAHEEGVQLLVFPELSITGYTCADLFHHRPLLHAANQAIMHLAEAARGIDMAVIVGAPIAYGNKFILPASEFLPQLLREMRHHPCGISCHMRIFVLEEGDDHLAELRIFCLPAIVLYGTYRLQFLEFLPH